MEEYSSRILQAKQAIKQADYIIIGAGSVFQQQQVCYIVEKSLKKILENL